MNKQGLHIIIDIYKYDQSILNARSTNDILKECRHIVEKNGLIVTSDAHHEFSDGSYTLAILLAESHICIHTWPEIDYVSCDVFVCNLKNDNTKKAEAIAKDIVSFYGATSISTQRYIRNMQFQER